MHSSLQNVEERMTFAVLSTTQGGSEVEINCNIKYIVVKYFIQNLSGTHPLARSIRPHLTMRNAPSVVGSFQTSSIRPTASDTICPTRCRKVVN